jgi:hypothetical protein
MMDSNKYLGSEDADALCCLTCLTVLISHRYLPFPVGHSVKVERSHFEFYSGNDSQEKTKPAK